MNSKSLFITFEGIEGCGKSTQLQLLKEFFRGKGEFITTREPAGTLIGMQIRNILANSKNKGMDGLTEFLLLSAARKQHVEEVLKPAIQSGKWIFCDRFADSSFAYQCRGRGVDEEIINQITLIATGGIKPDITFLLDVPVEVGISRIKNRAMKLERIELETFDFFERVRSGYLELVRREPDRVKLVNGTMDIKEVHEQILDKIFKYLNELERNSRT